MVCFRCDGKGTYRNEFGLMEKCESWQGLDMTLEKAAAEPDSDEEGYWEKREEKSSMHQLDTLELIHAWIADYSIGKCLEFSI